MKSERNEARHAAVSRRHDSRGKHTRRELFDEGNEQAVCFRSIDESARQRMFIAFPPRRLKRSSPVNRLTL